MSSLNNDASESTGGAGGDNAASSAPTMALEEARKVRRDFNSTRRHHDDFWEPLLEMNELREFREKTLGDKLPKESIDLESHDEETAQLLKDSADLIEKGRHMSSILDSVTRPEEAKKKAGKVEIGADGKYYSHDASGYRYSAADKRKSDLEKYYNHFAKLCYLEELAKIADVVIHKFEKERYEAKRKGKKG